MLNYGVHKIKYLIIGTCFITILGCAELGEIKSDKYRESNTVMGTIVKIDVCQNRYNQEHIQSAFSDVWTRLQEIGWRMNVLDEKSDVAKINNSHLEPVKVGIDTYEVIERAVFYSIATEGAFDITVWPLIELWRNSETKNLLPTHDEILQVKHAVGLNNVELLGKNLVKRNNNKTMIDLGGIAKGYAIDEAARIFREYGIMNHFIDAGGDVYAGGLNCSGSPWRVGIMNPEDRSQLVNIVELTDAAVTTSGNYEQYYTILDQQWSHIINPKTGYPQREVISATVIAPKAIDADALSTALTVLGGPLGTAHINALNDSYASLVIVKDQSQVIEQFASRTYKQFLKSSENDNK